MALVDVVVTNPDAQQDTLTNGFNYPGAEVVNVVVTNPDSQQDTLAGAFTYAGNAERTVTDVGRATEQVAGESVRPARRSVGAKVEVDSGNITVPLGTEGVDWAADDLALVFISYRGANTFSPHPGWTQVFQDNTGSNIFTGTSGRGGMACFKRVLAGGEGTPTFTRATEAEAAAIAVRVVYRPGKAGDIAQIHAFETWSASGSGATITYPLISPSSQDDMLVLVTFAADNGFNGIYGGTAAPPVTEFFDANTVLGSDAGLAVGDGLFQTGGDSPGRQSTYYSNVGETTPMAAWHRGASLVVKESILVPSTERVISELGQAVDSLQPEFSLPFDPDIGRSAEVLNFLAAAADTIEVVGQAAEVVSIEVETPGVAPVVDLGQSVATPSSVATAAVTVTDAGNVVELVASSPPAGVENVELTDVGRAVEQVVGAQVGEADVTEVGDAVATPSAVAVAPASATALADPVDTLTAVGGAVVEVSDVMFSREQVRPFVPVPGQPGKPGRGKRSQMMTTIFKIHP